MADIDTGLGNGIHEALAFVNVERTDAFDGKGRHTDRTWIGGIERGDAEDRAGPCYELVAESELSIFTY
jgi:hypothetical protein